MEAGSNRFYISIAKFIERTGAIGLVADGRPQHRMKKVLKTHNAE
jgi:hypothetical protein